VAAGFDHVADEPADGGIIRVQRNDGEAGMGGERPPTERVTRPVRRCRGRGLRQRELVVERFRVYRRRHASSLPDCSAAHSLARYAAGSHALVGGGRAGVRVMANVERLPTKPITLILTFSRTTGRRDRN
jgi:hypothetical protein